jgi:hypothetical protein
MNNTQAMREKVLLCAKLWWESKRPKGMGEGTHLKNATVNTDTVVEHQLARSIATLIKEGWDSTEVDRLVRDLLSCAKNDKSIDRWEILRRAEVFLKDQ